MFAELARQFTADPDIGVELLPLNAPIINRYLLDNANLATHLAVRDAGHEYRALMRYFMRVQPRRGQDIVHNTFYLPHGLVHYPKAKRVVTVHDMIPERMPETRRRLDLLTLKRHYLRQADHIICVSEATKRDLLEIYDDIQAPISVVHHGVDPAFRPGLPRVKELPERYIVFVGNRGSYKDANVLMKAFAQIKDDFPDHALLFVGGGAFSRPESETATQLRISDRIRQVSLPDQAMPAAYGHAEICVFPSRFEGFGLPALEAMACGTPAILADATSLPEVGGDAARYFAPGDAQDLARQLHDTLSDRAGMDHMVEAGIARASEFTWNRAAKETATVYRATLSLQ